MTKTEFVQMLAEGEVEFAVKSGEVIITYENHEAVFRFYSDGSFRDTWVRPCYGAAI
jgi:hypothetical protein